MKTYKDWICRYYSEHEDGEPDGEIIQELIRCKDCRFRNQFGFCHRWLWVSAPKMEDDEYCSGAERKEE